MKKLPVNALKEKSMETGIPFSDLLWGFLLEEFLRRVYASAFKDVLWLAGKGMLGASNYAKRNKGELLFYYLESSRPAPKGKIVPGQKLSAEVLEYLRELIFPAEGAAAMRRSGTADAGDGNRMPGAAGAGDGNRVSGAAGAGDAIYWQVTGDTDGADYRWRIAAYWEAESKLSYALEIPIAVRFTALGEKPGYPRREKLQPLLKGDSSVELLLYAPENRLARQFYEIMKKLELIADMEAYDAVNAILKTESVSGRLIMEELEALSAKEPSVLREKRMEQIAGYREYAYMRKRWEQYEKAHGRTPEPWSEVLDRFTAFAAPLWQALCRHEIFFDDWMPELGRYLS